MKKLSTSKVAVLMLALTLITSCFVGGTFAKYTAKITAEDTARVAKFEVSAFGETIDAVSDTTTVNLFEVDKVYDLDGADFDAPVADADIKTATDGTPIIAPGSWGKFSFDVENTSEVNVTYEVAYTATENDVPLYWSVDNGNTWEDNIADLDVAATALDMGDDATITVLWKWDFEGVNNDADDTALGFDGTAAPSVKVDVTFTQVD